MEITQLISAIDTVWVAFAAALIFLMEGGFALLESGFVRRKNAVSVVAKVMVDIIFGGLAFYIVGYGIMQGAGNGWFGFGLGLIDPSIKITVPKTLFWFIQMGFAVAAISIVSGAVLERMKIWAYALFVFLFTAIIYPLGAHWIWNAGGWLAKMGFNDFAGSAAVHAAGGAAACAAAIVIGPRLGKYEKNGKANVFPGHNLTLAATGTFILWFGWFGFNPGSTLAAVGNWNLIGQVTMNTFLASAAGGVATLVYTQLRYGKIDISMVMNGTLAGLVAITAGCNVVSPLSAIAIGLVAGVIVDVGVVAVDKMKVDDPVGAVAVHGVNGIWGTMAVGLFAAKDGLFTTGKAGLFGVQTLGAFAVAIFSFVVTFIIFTILKKTIGIRVTADEELRGIDLSEYGTEAYSSDK